MVDERGVADRRDGHEGRAALEDVGGGRVAVVVVGELATVALGLRGIAAGDLSDTTGEGPRNAVGLDVGDGANEEVGLGRDGDDARHDGLPPVVTADVDDELALAVGVADVAEDDVVLTVELARVVVAVGAKTGEMAEWRMLKGGRRGTWAR